MIALTWADHDSGPITEVVMVIVTITGASQRSQHGHTCGSLPGMDRTVRENALKLTGQLECAKPGDPLLPGVLRGLGWVIERYLAGNPPETEQDPGIHPARVRMRELLAGRGDQGATAGTLWILLQAEGCHVARETVQRWLALDAQAGLARRPERPHRGNSCWVIQQPPAVFRAGEPK